MRFWGQKKRKNHDDSIQLILAMAEIKISSIQSLINNNLTGTSQIFRSYLRSFIDLAMRFRDSVRTDLHLQTLKWLADFWHVINNYSMNHYIKCQLSFSKCQKRSLWEVCWVCVVKRLVSRFLLSTVGWIIDKRRDKASPCRNIWVCSQLPPPPDTTS